MIESMKMFQKDWKRVPKTELHKDAKLSLDKPFTEIEPLDLFELGDKVGNIYKMVVILGKRADKISAELSLKLKEELENLPTDSANPLEDIDENPKQQDIVRKYELMPKPTLQAVFEYLRGELLYEEPFSPYNL